MEAATRVAPGEGPALLDAVCHVLGAQGARLFVADYSLRRLQEVTVGGPVGEPQQIAGTMAGHAFASGEVMISEAVPTVLSVPLVDGTDRIGVVEFSFATWNGTLPVLLEPVMAVLVMVLLTKCRYGDLWVRARRSKPLSAAAEVQWDLLPPLSCSTEEVAVGGILEPAYEIGGDSFDYAINGPRLEFAIVDAIGRGMSAVLMSAATINSLRNSRRAGIELEAAYRLADRLIDKHFGNSFYVTGVFGFLDFPTGVLTWINAGHVLPMLVRNDSYCGELACAPSRPMGLGGSVLQVATEPLQRGDRVLFYTDGLTESRSPDGEFFGSDRLSDFLVRATLDRVPVAETARRLSTSVLAYAGTGLHDDSSLLLVEYRAHD